MCFFPIKAQKDALHGIKITNEGDIRLPCGKCSECIKKRSIEWATRCRHEISLHDENCFLTLTYDEKHLPPEFTDIKLEFKKFMKRLRKKLKKKLLYIVSHEYGSKTFRPHHHAIIFGWNPKNQKFLKTTGKDCNLFTSPDVENIWKKGYHSIGTANEKTAYYIASYALKGKKRILTHPVTGEHNELSDCMDVSKRPAIGLEYFKQNYIQLTDSKESLPRYYVKQLEKLFPEIHSHYESNQQFNFKNRSHTEIYAKYINDKQKLDNADTEYRKNELDKKQSNGLKYHLRYKHAEETAITREEKNVPLLSSRLKGASVPATTDLQD